MPSPPSDPKFRCGLVAILGRPNVGKSTLLNTLIGERIAAVSPKAQTTRRRFRGIRTDADAQLIFVDTPGMHRPPEGRKLNEFLVAEALDSLRDVDAVVYMIDASRPFRGGGANADSDEAYLLASLRRRLSAEPRPLFVLLNKQDLWGASGSFASQGELLAALEGLPVKGIFPLAAKSGAGVEGFLSELKTVLPCGPALFPEDELTDTSLRTVAGELIQEKLFFFLGDELPYSCAVEIEHFFEPDEQRRSPEIHAAIHVERESQKPMLIGKGGAKIKEIGQAARESIERLMGGKIVLKLFVKVTPRWSRDADQLRRLGYVLPERA